MHLSRLRENNSALVQRISAGVIAALLASTSMAIACPVAPPGVAVGDVNCVAAGSQVAPNDTRGDQLRIGSSAGATGSLTLSAGDKITLESGTDVDPGVAAPYAVIGQGAGSMGTLTINGTGAELYFDPQGNAANINIGRDGGHAVATVSNGGVIRMFSDTDLGGAPGPSGAGINVGRNGVGTVAELTLDAGTIDIDNLDGAYMQVGRNDASGAMTMQNGSAVTLAGTKAGSFTSLNVGGHLDGNSFGDLTVNASDVSVSGGAGGASVNIGRGAASVGSASFSNGATLSLTSDDRARIGVGDGSGAFGSLSFTDGSVVTLNSAKSFIDVGGTVGSIGVLTITGGSTVTLTTDDPTEADVLVGGAYSDFGGRAAAGDGVLMVSGAGSHLSLTDNLVVGALGGESSGRLTVASGGKVTAKTVWIGLGGRLDGNGGLLLADVIVYGGLLAPGASPGEMTISGDLSLSAGGMLEMEVDGAGTGEFDVLNVAGALDLSGGTTTFVFDQAFFDEVETNYALMPLLSSFFPWQDLSVLSGFSYWGAVDGATTFSLNFDALGALSAIDGVSQVPLPAALPSLMLGIGALVALRRRASGRASPILSNA
jgi:T5SS/PEP-CTERM-associated repeat protein